ncbi:unnamed protein product [Strongylus vulgaris]|uniref:non-specific serine/threonine protein kinase n=1 Tax=Strongylus vulgaris TaxID=40348 RepID=A0A3P7J326_STRVU|nr:unnamed protein product [Strongylus vulgaris]
MLQRRVVNRIELTVNVVAVKGAKRLKMHFALSFVLKYICEYADELRKNNKIKDNAFSMGCAISVGIQCLEAVQELHNVGYLHRDLKPANFCICVDDVRRIFLLDFGMCRRYIDSDNAVRRPRWASGFRGTQRGWFSYAAISCHISREMARKDDLESWLYQQVGSNVCADV